MTGINKNNNSYHKAFTIVELLVVIVVIAILAAITIVGYRGVSSNARKSALSSNLEQANKLLNVSKESSSTEVYPSTLSAAGSNLDTSIYTYYPSSDNKDYCLQGTTDGATKSITGSSQTVQASACTENGLVGWWKLNGDATDSSGNGNNGTVSGAVVTTGEDGVGDHAYLFDKGSTDNIGIGSKTLWTTSLTISFWLQANELPSAGGYYQRFFFSSDDQFSIYYDPGAQGIRVKAVSLDDNRPTIGESYLTTGWQHIVFIYNYDSSKAYLYINGTSLLRVVYKQGIISGNRTWLLGGSGGYNSFGGRLDDVRVYNRALSANEILKLYQNGAQ